MSFDKVSAAAEKMRARNEAKGVSFLNKDQKLEVYALMQQGSKGDVEGDRPGILSPIERAKWDAWEKLKGTSKEEAQKRFVELMLGYFREFKQDDLLAEVGA